MEKKKEREKKMAQQQQQQQTGKPLPQLDQNSTKELNLTVLQRMDRHVEDILTTAAHVTFYQFSVEDSQWVRELHFLSSSSSLPPSAGFSSFRSVLLWFWPVFFCGEIPLVQAEKVCIKSAKVAIQEGLSHCSKGSKEGLRECK